MNAAFVAVALSLVSAVAYAAAAVAQERLAARAPSGTGTLRLLADGAWWWSVALNASAALLHVVALKYGPLTLVQPLGALTLVAAVPMGARAAGRRVSPVEWRGTALTLLGLGAILVTASGPAPDQGLSLPGALAVAGTTTGLIGMLSWPGARPGLRHATASGAASGVASALTQTVTVAATGSSGALLDVRVVVVALFVAAFAAAGLLLSQTAYRGGLGAPLAVVTLTNPLAAAAIGLTMLGENLHGGATGVLLALAGAGLASWGVVLLTRATAAAPATTATEPVQATASVESAAAASAAAVVPDPAPVTAPVPAPLPVPVPVPAHGTGLGARPSPAAPVPAPALALALSAAALPCATPVEPALLPRPRPAPGQHAW